MCAVSHLRSIIVCVCMCVCLYLLHNEDQYMHFTHFTIIIIISITTSTICSVWLMTLLCISNLKCNYQNRMDSGCAGAEAVLSDVTHCVKLRPQPLT